MIFALVNNILSLECHLEAAVFTDEAELAGASLVVPLEVQVGPYVDTVLVVAIVVRLTKTPVRVLHLTPGHVVLVAAVLRPLRIQLPDELVAGRVSAIAGHPQVDTCSTNLVARVVHSI